MLARDHDSSLKHTPLHALHLARGGKMVPFAGYDMPVQFPTGVLKEHLHTRSNAGLFDVSHMGQIELPRQIGQGRGCGAGAGAAGAAGHPGACFGRQRYAQFTNDFGGILDDLMVANFGSHLFLVVNAACKADDEAHLRAHLSDACIIEPQPERALIALQGPKAEAVLARLCRGSAVDALHGCRAASGTWASTASCRAPAIPARTVLRFRCLPIRPKPLATALLDHADVLPIGLGARDSLRLEAGLCLYGHDIDTTTTPVEAALQWSIQKSRRNGGARAGGFPGAAKFSQSWKAARRARGSGCSRRAAPRCARARRCSSRATIRRRPGG